MKLKFPSQQESKNLMSSSPFLTRMPVGFYLCFSCAIGNHERTWNAAIIQTQTLAVRWFQPVTRIEQPIEIKVMISHSRKAQQMHCTYDTYILHIYIYREL